MRSVTSAISDRAGSHSFSTHLKTEADYENSECSVFSTKFNFLRATARSLVLMEEYRLRVFENRAVRRIFAPRRVK